LTLPRLWPPSPFEEFERAFDELFNSVLIRPWRDLPAPLSAEQTVILDHGNSYEVRLYTGDADPHELDVEVADHRLIVRAAAGGGGLTERTFTFAEPVDRETVSARWAEGKLIIVLPKKRQPQHD